MVYGGRRCAQPLLEHVTTSGGGAVLLQHGSQSLPRIDWGTNLVPVALQGLAQCLWLQQLAVLSLKLPDTAAVSHYSTVLCTTSSMAANQQAQLWQLPAGA